MRTEWEPGDRSRADEGRSIAIELVDRFTTFLRTRFVYPANNRRCVESTEDLLATLRVLVGGGASVAVRFRDATAMVDGRRFEDLSPLTRWVSDHLTRCLVGSIRFGPAVVGSSLAALAERIQAATATDGGSFLDGWRGAPGIEVAPLEFTDPDTEGDAPDESTPHAAPFPAGSPRAILLERLRDQEAVSAAVAALGSVTGHEVAKGGTLASIDPLVEIIGMMSIDVVADHARAEAAALEALRHIHDDLVQGIRDGHIDANVELAELLTGVARELFEISAVPSTERQADLPSGRPEDEGIRDDIDSLLWELDQLPESRRVELFRDAAKFNGECCGVLLHRIVSEPLDDAWRSAEPRLVELLRTPTLAVEAIVEPYLARALDVDAEPRDRRVIEVLRRNSLCRYLQRTGQLEPEIIAGGFPDLFAVFLDALPPADPTPLVRLCALLGHERIAAAADTLCAREGILRGDRVDRVVATRSPEVAPLVEVIAVHGGASTRHKVAHYLRGMTLPAAEAAALRAIEPPSALPCRYLRDLCECLRTAAPSYKLRDYSGFLLRAFAAEATAPELVAHRIEAIRALRLLPSTDTILLLQSLTGARELFRFGAHHRLARRAARETLRAITS